MRTDRNPHSNGPAKQELYGRKILLGVCGGIAAYKAVELVRLLIKNGARVQVIMTESATKFVAPLTFEAITARNVFVEMFPDHGEASPWHTELATWPDLAVVAPATANHMARLAAGLADDLLSTIMLTLERPKLLAPSMNHRMWANPATQDNLVTLKRRGYRVIMPEVGQMARPGEEEGVGRLAEPEMIYKEIHHILSAPQDLRGVRVLVTAGRTEESWDPVRVLTNRASGRMGFALAEEARERGADVMLIHGPTDVIPPTGVRIRKITTASEMASAVKQEIYNAKIVLMSAAVADYTFTETASHKIKKGDPSQEVKLVPTEDILKTISQKKGDRIMVGFALETENLLENSLKKLREKHLDIVVANNPLTPGGGFAEETNQVLIIHRSGRVHDLPLQSKREIAREILNAVIHIYRNPEPEPEIEPEEDTEDFTSHLYQDIDSEIIAEMAAEESKQATVVVPEPERTPKPVPPVNQDPRRRPEHEKHHKPAPQIAQGQPRKPEPEKPIAPVPPVAQVAPKKVEPERPFRPAQSFTPDPAKRPEPAPVRPEIPSVTEPVQETLSADSVPSESPATPLPAHKSGRNRRGGRRSAKARAAKRLAMAGGAPQESEAHTPAPEASHEPVVISHPVVEPVVKPVVVESPVHTEPVASTDQPAKKPTAKRPPRPKKSKPKTTQESLPAVVTEAVAPPSPVVTEAEPDAAAAPAKKKSATRRSSYKKPKNPVKPS